MSNTSRFDFCPKCGALEKDGVCQGCGYVRKKRVPKQKGSNGRIAISIIILLMMLIFCSGMVAYLSIDFSAGAEDAKQTKESESEESYRYYVGPYNALKDDLLYQVEFKEEDFRPEDHIGKVRINVEYPQLTGAALNLEVINSYLENEYWYYKQYFDERYEPNMDEYGNFYVASLGYVTYMDDNVMSIVFHEEINVDGKKSKQYYCLNFDMEAGALINNMEILNIDMDFVKDFMKRVDLQRGVDWLSENTDEEVLEYFQDWDHLVIYYTPMGMEVGLNLYSNILTVTYKDYEQFLK